MAEDQEDRAARIAAARAELARRHAERPVDKYEARQARLAASAKRERERVDHLVLGKPRPKPELVKPKGMSRQEWKVEKERQRAAGAALSPGIEEAVGLHEAWSHKQGTPETLEAASRTHTGALAQLHANGTIDNEQLEWAAEIANVHRSIEADVTVAVASLEARVDQSRSSAALAGESIRRVRLHLAYGLWRDRLPQPKRMVLDMIVGDAVGYTVAAERYHTHKRRAKRLLLAAIDSWPVCVDEVYHSVTDDEIRAANDEAR